MDYMRQGPREDSGFASDTNPGIQLVERIYNYCAKLHPKTRVMVSGIRAKKVGKDAIGQPVPVPITSINFHSHAEGACRCAALSWGGLSGGGAKGVGIPERTADAAGLQ